MNESAISQPKRMIQKIFIKGCAEKSDDTFFPKGNATSDAILKHCLPNGIPIMVIHKSIPVKI